MNEKYKIVIVEDDVFLGEMYVTKFELEGFKISLANNGDDGLKLVKKIKPDLILLDIIMPKKNGFEVLEELKKDKTLKDIPVILLTNMGQNEDIEKGLKMGAVDYLIKAHFIPSEVIQKVKDILEKQEK